MKTTHPSEEKFIQKFKKLPEGRKTQVLDFIDFLARRNPRRRAKEMPMQQVWKRSV